MTKEKRSVLTIAAFALVVFGLFFALLLTPDAQVSRAERRKLAQAPALTWQGVASGDYMDELETYLLDQFPLRDGFRTIKAALRFYLFGQLDNNGVYLYDGSVFKMEYPLNETQAAYAANKISTLSAGLPEGVSVYYSVIPDKNYFAAQQSGHMHLDYDRLLTILEETVTTADYIDLFPRLSLEDYYRTDAHWRQEQLVPVAEALAAAMGAEPAPQTYTAHTLSPFYGVYCGQSALPVAADELVYLTSPLTESAMVTGIEFDGTRSVYNPERFAGMDGYDVFLSGAQAILTIETAEPGSGRELVIFRDSFASSLAPLLLGAYSKVTLIDLRYISSSLLEQYVQFDDQDVLFLYSTSLLNSGMLLK